MQRDDTKHPYATRKYEVVPYDFNWPSQFEKYAAKIQAIFGDTVEIEHIGSTAVPSLSGKPCIDILVILKDKQIDDVEKYVEAMEQAGFEYAGQFVMENSRLFRVMNGSEVSANIHIFPKGHPHNKEMLDMRDYLRTHEEAAAAYAKLKEDLNARYPNDYAIYRQHKDVYMAELKQLVVEEFGNQSK